MRRESASACRTASTSFCMLARFSNHGKDAIRSLRRQSSFRMFVSRLSGQVFCRRFAALQRFPHVSFLGERPYKELPINQRAADVLVIPNTARTAISARFTSPLKAFAHMASDVPIVASDVPSIREALSETNAFFFAPDDARSLADACDHVGAPSSRRST